MRTPLRQPRIAIIGAGMSGICLGALLTDAGIEDFTLYEKASSAGGTWRENSYPGIACDVPSRFYQYTFARNPDWSRPMAPGAEINAYFAKVARDTGVHDRIQYGAEVARIDWVDGRWSVTTTAGASAAYDFVISATGILHHPRYPDLDGLDTFAGPAFHSARWDHAVPLEGRRIGVIGTGSTGAQIVTDLAGSSAELVVFQRTPHWVMQMRNPEFSRLTRWLHRRFPRYDALTYHGSRLFIESFSSALLRPGLARRFGQWLIRRQLRRIEDPTLRARLTPDFEPMCRRLIISTGYYDAVQRDDVRVVTEAIDQVEPTGVRTADGVLHECDVLVLATGFDSHAYLRPAAMTGPGGLTLDDAWADGPRAYRTIAVPGFPNFFMFMGPNSPVGNYSLVAIAEAQASAMLAWIERWRRREVDTVAPTTEATDAFYRDVDAAMPATVWATGCTSWYVGQGGRVELFPWAPKRFRSMLAAIDDDAFETTTPA
ncbi:flavin-containing monooxygenase [Nocardioides stalactiti]|uniref:flavin-containing monooxygenase n=1 Tax=Nocardioides stalactiti TaxID=2755356 RepID=UPI001C7F1814|nr:NAD(P)/FAD-dependent oxidoreductase [Nocardioides stalactiti]